MPKSKVRKVAKPPVRVETEITPSVNVQDFFNAGRNFELTRSVNVLVALVCDKCKQAAKEEAELEDEACYWYLESARLILEDNKVASEDPATESTSEEESNESN
jgi:hypothetical protein